MANGATQQSEEALALANKTRLARADLKKEIKRGETTVAEVLRALPEYIHKMSLAELLRAQDRWGKRRVERFLQDCEGLSESKKCGTLTLRQRRLMIQTGRIG